MKFKQIVICYRFIPGKKDPDADITEFEVCMQQAIKKYNCLFQFASADLKKGKGRIWFEENDIQYTRRKGGDSKMDIQTIKRIENGKMDIQTIKRIENGWIVNFDVAGINPETFYTTEELIKELENSLKKTVPVGKF